MIAMLSSTDEPEDTESDPMSCYSSLLSPPLSPAFKAAHSPFAHGNGPSCPPPLPPHDDSVEEMQLLEVEALIDGAVKSGTNLYTFFDASLVANWSGKGHWKVRKAAAPASQIDKDEEESDDPITRRRKGAFSLDFSVETEPKWKIGERSKIARTKNIDCASYRAMFLLPEDLHINWTMLSTFFTRNKEVPQLRSNSSSVHAADGAEGGGNIAPYPFDSQLEASVIDEGDYSDSWEATNKSNHGDRPNATTLEGETLHYARVAKRVNVRRLKEELWKQVDTHERGTAELSLKTVLETKGEILSDEKREVSVPFCFICLLHLANENGIELKSDETFSDVIVQ
uniref:Condensin complex subunit 2 n=1 Tax=Palpitomonas bilix TaxID=652834 RepID=A0A7S3GKX8_9EUKA